MAWVDLEERVAAKSRFDASVRLYQRSASSMPALIISLRKPIMLGLKWKPTDAFGLALGKDDNSGRVRIIRRKDKVKAIATPRQMKTGSLSFDFGHVAQYGECGTLKAEALAVIIDADTVEVTIPTFEYDDDEQTGDDAVTAPAKQAREPEPAASRPANGPSRIGEPPVNLNGIIVEFNKDVECVRYKGKTAELTLRQAILVGECVKAMPKHVVRGLVINKIFGLRPPSTADAVLDQIALDLASTLPEVGLKLKNWKGSAFSIEVV